MSKYVLTGDINSLKDIRRDIEYLQNLEKMSLERKDVHDRLVGYDDFLEFVLTTSFQRGAASRAWRFVGYGAVNFGDPGRRLDDAPIPLGVFAKENMQSLRCTWNISTTSIKFLEAFLYKEGTELGAARDWIAPKEG